MAREMEEKTIGDVKYSITQYDTKLSYKIFQKLLSCVGSGIAGAVSGGKGAKELLDGEVEDMIPGFMSAMMAKIDDEDYVYDFAKQICSCAIAEVPQGSKRPGGHLKDNAFDAHFRGHMADSFKLCYACLEVNYTDFLGGLKDLFNTGLDQLGKK